MNFLDCSHHFLRTQGPICKEKGHSAILIEPPSCVAGLWSCTNPRYEPCPASYYPWIREKPPRLKCLGIGTSAGPHAAMAPRRCWLIAV